MKDEIRRHERNQVRAEAAENLEYLKNVTLKFLGGTEEQEQLIPVMAKLLHFSADELRHVRQARARAASAANPQASALDSLASFLPRWT